MTCANHLILVLLLIFVSNGINAVYYGNSGTYGDYSWNTPTRTLITYPYGFSPTNQYIYRRYPAYLITHRPRVAYYNNYPTYNPPALPHPSTYTAPIEATYLQGNGYTSWDGYVKAKKRA